MHLSGNAIHKNFCLPDRNLLTTTQVAQRIGQISEATDIPLIVDGGSICAEPIALTRAVKLYERAGAAAIRFEDALVNEYGAAPGELAIAPTAAVVDQLKGNHGAVVIFNPQTGEVLATFPKPLMRPCSVWRASTQPQRYGSSRGKNMQYGSRSFELITRAQDR